MPSQSPIRTTRLARAARPILLWAGAIGFALSSAAVARPGEPVFTVAKYPVEATGKNAVTAKREAIAQGRRSAFRSLLKRLVPAAHYDQIEHIKKLDPEPYIGSIRVRAEENSSTQYIATLDFSFEPDAVRALLGQHGVTYVDRPSPVSRLLLLYRAPKGVAKAMAGRKGSTSWRRVWADLDLANSLTPLRLVRKPGRMAPEVADALVAAQPDAIRSLADHYKARQLIVAEARPVPASNELHVTLAGQDAVGRFAVTTRYRLDEDFVYSLELAAVIAQGVIEGRWKTQMAGGGQPGATGGPSGGAPASLEVLAEFNNLGQWQRQQQVLSSTPGVRNMQIGSLSGRSARIALSYPGGGTALQAALGPRGLTLENINGFWILR